MAASDAMIRVRSLDRGGPREIPEAETLSAAQRITDRLAADKRLAHGDSYPLSRSDAAPSPMLAPASTIEAALRISSVTSTEMRSPVTTICPRAIG